MAFPAWAVVVSVGWLVGLARWHGQEMEGTDVLDPRDLVLVSPGAEEANDGKPSGPGLRLVLAPGKEALRRAPLLAASADAEARRQLAGLGIEPRKLGFVSFHALRAASLPGRRDLAGWAHHAAALVREAAGVALAGPPDPPPWPDEEEGGGESASYDWLLERGPEPGGEEPPGGFEEEWGGPRARVLHAAPLLEGADPAELAGLRRYASLARPLRCVPAPDPEAAAAGLLARFPWMGEAVGVVRRELALRPPGGPSTVAPLLLVGEPGGGKTSFARAVLDVLGVPGRLVPVADGGAVTALAGAGRGWRGARPALPLQIMRAEGVATVGVIVDDADREPPGPAHGSALAWLLAVTEPAAAARFHDPFLEVECDLRPVTWILTVNDQERLPEAVRDRCTTIRVERPPAAALPGVITRMADDILQETGWTAAGSSPALPRPQLSQGLVRLLLAAVGATVAPASLRAIRRAVRAALAAVQLGDDPAAAAMKELGQRTAISPPRRDRTGGRPH